MITVPATALMRSPIPSMTARPIPSIPSMKSTSVAGLAIPAKKGCSGPVTASLPRKPWLGVPPLTQARSTGVENPSPNVLSRKAHRKMNPMARRRMARARCATGRSSAAVLATGGAAAVTRAAGEAMVVMTFQSLGPIAFDDRR